LSHVYRYIMECEPSELQRTLFFPLMLVWFIAMIFGISAPPLVIRVVACIGIIFGVFAAWFGLKLMLRKGPTLIINESGINDKRLGVGQIPWTAVSSVSAYEVRNKPFIELWLSDESTYVSRLPRWQRMYAPIVKVTGHSPFVISMTFLTPGFKPVYEYVLRFVPARER
jgi:hypothetical protein